jgi:uncharacterized protein (DUF1810 family)
MPNGNYDTLQFDIGGGKRDKRKKGRGRGRGQGQEQGRGRGGPGRGGPGRDIASSKNTSVVDTSTSSSPVTKHLSAEQKKQFEDAKIQKKQFEDAKIQKIQFENEKIQLNTEIIDLQNQISNKLGNASSGALASFMDNIWDDNVIKQVYLKINNYVDTNQPTYTKLSEILDNIIKKRTEWVEIQNKLGDQNLPTYKSSLFDILHNVNTNITGVFSNKEYFNVKETIKKLNTSIKKEEKEQIKLQQEIFESGILNNIKDTNKNSSFFKNALKYNYEALKVSDLKQLNSKLNELNIIPDKWDKLINIAQNLETIKNKKKSLETFSDDYNPTSNVAESEITILSWNVKKLLNKKNKDSNLILSSVLEVINNVTPDILILQENVNNFDIKNSLDKKLEYDYTYQSDDGYNTIFSKYPFNAMSYFPFPPVEIGKDSDDYKVLLNYKNINKEKKFLNIFKGGAESNNNTGYENLETQKKGTNNFIIVQFKLKDNNILHLVNTELAHFDIGATNDKKTINIQKSYDKIRKEQIELLHECIDNPKKWFGFKFQKPTYQIISGDFHNNYNSDNIKLLLNNYDSPQENISNPEVNTEFIFFSSDLKNQSIFNDEYGQIPIPDILREGGLNLPIYAKLTNISFDNINNNVNSNPPILSDIYKSIKIGTPSIKKDNVSRPERKSTKSTNTTVAKKLPGLNESQQNLYNKLKIKKTLTPEEKEKFKKLKTTTEKASKKENPINIISEVLEQGVASLKNKELSPCPALDYLPCFKLNIDDIKIIIKNVINTNLKIIENTEKHINKLEKKEKSGKINDKGDKERLEELEQRENDIKKLKELKQKKKEGTLDIINKDDLAELENKELEGKLILDDREKNDLSKLKQKRQKGTLELSEKEKLHDLRLKQVDHITQKIKAGQISGTLTEQKQKEYEDQINKIHQQIKIAKKPPVVSTPGVSAPGVSTPGASAPGVSATILQSNIDRFIKAQDSGINSTINPTLNRIGTTYDVALNEIKNGTKTSHWIWYVYPIYYPNIEQSGGFEYLHKQRGGHSKTSNYFFIRSIQEAKEYIKNTILRQRYIDINNEVLTLLKNGKSLNDIFSDDDQKVIKSLTLFYIISSVEKDSELYNLIKEILQFGNNDNLDTETIKLMNINSELNKTDYIHFGEPFRTLQKVEITKEYLLMWIDIALKNNNYPKELQDQINEWQDELLSQRQKALTYQQGMRLLPTIIVAGGVAAYGGLVGNLNNQYAELTRYIIQQTNDIIEIQKELTKVQHNEQQKLTQLLPSSQQTLITSQKTIIKDLRELQKNLQTLLNKAYQSASGQSIAATRAILANLALIPIGAPGHLNNYTKAVSEYKKPIETGKKDLLEYQTELQTYIQDDLITKYLEYALKKTKEQHAQLIVYKTDLEQTTGGAIKKILQLGGTPTTDTQYEANNINIAVTSATNAVAFIAGSLNSLNTGVLTQKKLNNTKDIIEKANTHVKNINTVLKDAFTKLKITKIKPQQINDTTKLKINGVNNKKIINTFKDVVILAIKEKKKADEELKNAKKEIKDKTAALATSTASTASTATTSTVSTASTATGSNPVKVDLYKIEDFLNVNYNIYKPEKYFYNKSAYLYYWTSRLTNLSQNKIQLYGNLNNIFNDLENGNISINKLTVIKNMINLIENNLTINNQELEEDFIKRIKYFELWIKQIDNRDTENNLDLIKNNLQFSEINLKNNIDLSNMYIVAGYIKQSSDYLEKNYSIYISFYLLLWLLNIYKNILVTPIFKKQLDDSDNIYKKLITDGITLNLVKKTFSIYNFLNDSSNDPSYIINIPSDQNSSLISKLTYEYDILKNEINNLQTSKNLQDIDNYITTVNSILHDNIIFPIHQLNSLINIYKLKKQFITPPDKIKIKENIPEIIVNNFINNTPQNSIVRLINVQMEISNVLGLFIMDNTYIPNSKNDILKLKLTAILNLYKTYLQQFQIIQTTQLGQLQKIQNILNNIVNLFSGTQTIQFENVLTLDIKNINELLEIISLSQSIMSGGGKSKQYILPKIPSIQIPYVSLPSLQTKKKKKLYDLYGGVTNQKQTQKLFNVFNKNVNNLLEPNKIKQLETSLSQSQNINITDKLQQLYYIMNDIINKSKKGLVDNETININEYISNKNKLSNVLNTFKHHSNVNNSNANNSNANNSNANNSNTNNSYNSYANNSNVNNSNTNNSYANNSNANNSYANNSNANNSGVNNYDVNNSDVNNYDANNSDVNNSNTDNYNVNNSNVNNSNVNNSYANNFNANNSNANNSYVNNSNANNSSVNNSNANI